MVFENITGTGLAVFGAAIAVGAAGLSSAFGAGIVGSTGARVTAEDPKKFSTSLLFQALPQTQGIYGFLIAILILLGAGIIGTEKNISIAQGLGAVGAGLAVGIAAISAIGQGIASSAGLGASSENKKMLGKSILFSVLPETQALYGFLIAILIMVGVGLFGNAVKDVSIVMGLATIGAGLAVGLAGVSAIGQGIAAAGSISAVLEKAKVFGKGIIFSVLPETQALYGFIISILILIGFGVLGMPKTSFGLALGFFAIAAGLGVGLAGVSAVGQGITASAGVGAVASNPKMFGRSILFSVLPETQALYAFLISILILVGGGILGAAKAGIDTAVGVMALGASIAVGLAAVSAIGQGMAAASGIKSISEKKGMFGKSLTFSIIPETQALYGFLIAVLLLVGGGVIGAVKAGLTLPIGLISVGAGLAVGLAGVSAVGQGYAVLSGISATTQNNKLFGKSLLFSVLPETQALYGFLIAVLLLAGGGIIGATKAGLTSALGLFGIGAGLAVGLAAVSAIGQGMAAAAGISSISEKKEMFGKSLIFSIIPETQALMGFLIAILLLIGGGIMGAIKSGIELPTGLIAIGAGLAVGLAGVSAVGQGTVISAGVAGVTQDKKLFGKSLLFSVLPQTQALYGFLIAILLLAGGGIIGAAKLGITTPIGIIALGASLAVGLAAVSSIGQGMAAASGIGSISEKKEMFGKSLIFSIIPETQALMGFLIAILLLIGSGIMGGIKMALGMPAGLIALGSGLAIGLAGVSALGQGYVISSGIAITTKIKKMFGKSLLFSVLPQTQALYGFLVAILLLVGGGLIGVVKPGITVPMGLVAIGAGIAVGIAAVSAIGQGIAASGGIVSTADNEKMFGKSIIFSVIPETQALNGFLIAVLLLITGGLVGTAKPELTIPVGLVAIGSGIAVGIAAFSAIGLGIAANSGTGAVTEKPKLFGISILFTILPETQALYGIIISVLLLTGVGIFSTINTGITLVQGLAGIAAGLAMGLAAVSAVGQGVVSASSIGASLRDRKAIGKSLVLSAIPETYAIFGLLISILIMIGIKLM